jgi:hypothetical protein
MLVLLMDGIYIYAVEMPSCGSIFLPSSMTIGSGIYRNNLRDCNIIITDRRDLCR